MADAIESLINDYDYRLSLGKSATENSKKYSLEAIEMLWKDFIDSI